MRKKANLAAALADAGGSTRRRPMPVLPVHEPATEKTRAAPESVQPGRVGTRAITAHFPEDVRRELKKIALDTGTTLQNLLAEAFNDLFAKYGRPEIAPLEKG